MFHFLCLPVTASSDQPNIILVLVDDLGWGSVGYNGDVALTPNIDRISAGGIRFERFYVQPICTPTRAALMTGRYPWRMGMASGVILNHLHYALPLEEVTLAQVLREAGYRNYIVGKWHLGHHEAAYLPTKRGFDYHYGLYTAIDHFTRMWQVALDWHRNRRSVREEGYATDLLGDDAVRIIREHDFSDKPMFLYYPMFAVHGHFQAPEKYTSLYSDVTEPRQRQLLGLCSAMDLQFGRMIEALEERSQLSNTFILFFSDNGGVTHIGGSFNGPLRGGKGQFYEGGVRVPAFAFWPGRIAPGVTSEALIFAADVFPTLVNIAGGNLPDVHLDGFDVRPVLFDGAATSGRSEVILMLRDSERDARGSIIDWPWKLVRRNIPDSGWVYELFDLNEDPYEQQCLADRHPRRKRMLSERLDELAEESPPALFREGDRNIPDGWQPGPVIGPDS